MERTGLWNLLTHVLKTVGDDSPSAVRVKKFQLGLYLQPNSLFFNVSIPKSAAKSLLYFNGDFSIVKFVGADVKLTIIWLSNISLDTKLLLNLTLLISYYDTSIW